MTSLSLFPKIWWNIRVIHKVTLFSACPWASYPLFQWYPQSNDILLNLSMKCWNSAFTAQGSRLIIIVVQLGTVKIKVVAVEALRIKERQDETQFTTKSGGLFISSLYDAIHGWMTGRMDGKSFMTTTSFTICNILFFFQRGVQKIK